MVDALRETLRVLKPEGLLLDLRPQASNIPLDVIRDGNAKPVFRLDGSPGLPDDVASDNAVQRLVDEGAFTPVEESSFLFRNYWDTVDEMCVDATETWSRYVVPETDDLDTTRRELDAAGPGACIGTTKRIWLSIYRSI